MSSQSLSRITKARCPKIADRIVAAMNEPFEIENQHLQISPSIGIAIYPEAGEDALSILQHADMAMYEAKNKGKTVALYTKELYKNGTKSSN